MNICIFGAASPQIDELYIKEVEDLAEKLAKRGHDLVFGGGSHGLMGAAARGTHRGGGKVYGVIPKFFRKEKIEDLYEECDRFFYTDTMANRKAKMEELADAFIVTPGGIGTFEEFFEVLTLKQLGRHKKPIAVFNINGYYYGIMALMHNGVEEFFLRENCQLLYKVFEEDEDEAVIAYVEATDEHPSFEVNEVKYG